MKTNATPSRGPVPQTDQRTSLTTIADEFPRTPSQEALAMRNGRGRNRTRLDMTSAGDEPEAVGFLTVKETARHLRLCEKQVRRLISRGDLPAYRFGTALRIKKDDIDAYVESQRI